MAASDLAALAAAYDAHAPRLFAAARRLVPTQADAEECVQEVFVKLVARGGGLAEVVDVAAYLFASLRHAAAARAVRVQKRDALHALAATGGAPHLPGADPTLPRQLEVALQTLPLEQREVIALKVDADLTFAEIGKALDISLNTAASRYRYALARLKAALGGQRP